MYQPMINKVFKDLEEFFEKNDREIYSYLSKECNDGSNLSLQYKGKLHELSKLVQETIGEVDLFV